MKKKPLLLLALLLPVVAVTALALRPAPASTQAAAPALTLPSVLTFDPLPAPVARPSGFAADSGTTATPYGPSTQSWPPKICPDCA